MVSQVLQQAILNLKGPDLVGSFREGREFARQDQIKDLSGRAAQGEEGALDELRGIDPEIAFKIGESIGARDARGVSEFVRDSRVGLSMLSAGDPQGFVDFANNRIENIRASGGNTQQTEKIRDRVLSGDVGGAIQELQAFGNSLEAAKESTLDLAKARKLDAETQQIQQGPLDREIIKDGQGFSRYVDTGERVFPGVEKPADDDKIFSRAAKLRGEIAQSSKKFDIVEDAFGRIGASASDPSAAGDLSLIFAFMKILDPGSTVREGEFATAAQAGGVDDRIRGQYNKLLSGERLTQNQRDDFVNRSKKLFNVAQAGNKKRVDKVLGFGEKFNIPANLLVGEPEAPAPAGSVTFLGFE
jgi:hypothetical protein